MKKPENRRVYEGGETKLFRDRTEAIVSIAIVLAAIAFVVWAFM